MYNSLVKTTEEMFKLVDEAMDGLYACNGVIHALTGMNDEEVLAFKKILILMDTAKEYSLLMAEKLDKIDTIDKKLDKLLEVKKEA